MKNFFRGLLILFDVTLIIILSSIVISKYYKGFSFLKFNVGHHSLKEWFYFILLFSAAVFGILSVFFKLKIFFIKVKESRVYKDRTVLDPVTFTQVSWFNKLLWFCHLLYSLVVSTLFSIFFYDVLDRKGISMFLDIERLLAVLFALFYLYAHYYDVIRVFRKYKQGLKELS